MIVKSIELYSKVSFIEGYTESRQANYRYILLEAKKEINYHGKIVTVPCYGIEIIMEDMDGSSVGRVESENIECISTYRYKVVQLLRKLADNLVSPIHLIDIAGPITDEWVNDFDNIISEKAVQ